MGSTGGQYRAELELDSPAWWIRIDGQPVGRHNNLKDAKALAEVLLWPLLKRNI